MSKIEADWLRSEASQAVCRVLTEAGFQAWFVGGCVRNALLGLPVTDLDVTTDARPEDVMALAQAAGLEFLANSKPVVTRCCAETGTSPTNS